jgi:hypothetical protein
MPVNRLTKEIGLVLISSSLVLHGCSRPEEPDLVQNPNPQNRPSGTSSNTWHSHPSHVPFYHGGYYGSSGGYRPGSSMGSSGIAGSAAGASSVSSHAGGSARGGFGATGHGASS